MVKGSMTVEAAYLFPFCFLIIGIVCYLGVFSYNQAVLKMTGYECILLVTEQKTESDEALRKEILRLTQQTAKERVLGVSELNVTVKLTATKISVVCTGVQTMLNVPVRAEAVYERVYPEQTLRILQGI